MNTALLHDWLNQLGGAEDVLEVLHELFPGAPIFTSIYDRARMPSAWRQWNIRSTWMDRLPGIYQHHQPYMPLYALTFAAMRVPAEYDMVVSNKSAFCMGAHASGRHVCYCLTPTRFTYDFNTYSATERIPAAVATALQALNMVLRRWERAAAQRVTAFIAISSVVQQRIKRYYDRDSVIVHPPVRIDKYTVSNTSAEYFLSVSRLLPYKRLDLAIKTFNQLGLPLVIAGDGRDRSRLQQLAGSNVKLIGRVDDSTLHSLLANCKAFIFPGLEDFGIAPINAMACGKPVIAYAAGGSLDYVIDGITGVLFKEQSTESLGEAVRNFLGVRFAPSDIRTYAERFGVERFRRELLDVVSHT